MRRTKLLLSASAHVLARPLRDYLRSRGFELIHTPELQAMTRIAETRRPVAVLIDLKRLTALQNGKLAAFPNCGFRAVITPASQLMLIQPYLQRKIVNDYLIAPVNKGQLACLLEKLDGGEPTSLEQTVEIKLDEVLSQVDLKTFNKLHAMIMPRLERPLLRMVLNRTDGNQIKAAAILGINRNTLRNRLKQLHVKV